jgi:hypothetical protein
VGILRKVDALPHITHLDPDFKSRVYERFLRGDPNTSKVTGKYFTPGMDGMEQVSPIEKL